MRTTGKRSLVARAGQLLERAGLREAIAEGDLVAVKMHFGEAGNTGFVQPIYLREVVARIKAAGGSPFLTDANTLYRGARGNSVDHLACAIHNGFSYATVEAPVIIADGLDGRDAVDVPVPDGTHFDTVRIGSAAVHADAMVVVTHFKGHEATGFGGALKNVGMGLGCRSAKQRMHADFRPEVTGEKCTACGRCVKWCPVDAITIGPDRVAHVDYELCYGCGECVAACPESAIAAQWKTTPEAIQEKIVEHAAGALAGKDGKTVFLTFLTNISPDCDCWHFSDAGVVADIGVLASTDIVAVEQAALDLVNGATGLPGTRGEGLAAGAEKFAAITGIDGTHAVEYAELLGLGTRSYELKTLE
ncbi:MAG: 4Fe-4S ferredoxin [Coriobacteriaceae bacterium]|nr:4Fe-4S ferredoxin [Coriobacteriaceae bacterium]